MSDTPMQESKHQPTEAGFSTNFYLTHKMIGRQQFTFRGATSADWNSAMEDAAAFCKHMREQGWLFDNEAIAALPQAAAPKTPVDVEIVAKENKVLAETFKADYDKVPDPPAGKVWQVLTVALVKVIPQPEGRVNIEFFEAGHKWADAKVQNWKLDSAVGLMKHVTSEPMDKPGEYKLDCALYYVDGKEKPNKPGTFYRDVMHVRPMPY